MAVRRTWQAIRSTTIWLGSLMFEMLALPVALVLGLVAFIAATVAQKWRR